MIAPLLLLAALVAEPGAVPAEAAPAARVQSIADTDMREFAAIEGRKVVGRPVGGPYPTADKILLLARNDKGYPVVAGSTGFPVRQSLPAPPTGVLAVVRIHQRYETVVPGPTPDDVAFVAANKLPLFVIGEWARPAPMWEVAWINDTVQYRSIGDVGEIGPWQD